MRRHRGPPKIRLRSSAHRGLRTAAMNSPAFGDRFISRSRSTPTRWTRVRAGSFGGDSGLMRVRPLRFRHACLRLGVIKERHSLAEDGGTSLGGKSELSASTATFQLPSVCFFQISTYFPLSVIGMPVASFTVKS